MPDKPDIDETEQTEATLGTIAGHAPIKARLIGEQMTQMLRDAIISMHFAPGARLVVRELEEWSGVSRATIRESLRELAAEGLVTVVPQKGAVVATPSVREADEIYEIRAMLEALVGRQFVERASAGQRRQLRAAFEEIKALVVGGADGAAQLRAKNAYYDVLFDGADNATVRSVLSTFQARITLLRATTMAQKDRGAGIVRELTKVVEAIEAGDAEAAGQACFDHVRAARATAMAVLNTNER